MHFLATTHSVFSPVTEEKIVAMTYDSTLVHFLATTDFEVYIY